MKIQNFSHRVGMIGSKFGVAGFSGLAGGTVAVGNLQRADFSKLPDENLFNLCRVYGGRSLLWRQKFIGLLPEVFKRKLFEKKGFSSIFEFAKKLAGLSEEQVRVTLNLEKRFEKLPELKSLLVNGEVSVSKLARVVSIANADNEQFLAENVKNLSKSAVETLVRDEKWARKEGEGDTLNRGGNVGNFGICGVVVIEGLENQNGLFETKIEAKSLPGQTVNVQRMLQLKLSPEVHEKLFELQLKGIDVNQLLLEFLQKCEEGINEKKEQIREKVLAEERNLQKSGKEPGRQVPVLVKKILKEDHGTKCAVKNCKKLSVQIHHVLPFSIGKSHDPKYLVPLCKEHHELEHAVNWEYRKTRREFVGGISQSS